MKKPSFFSTVHIHNTLTDRLEPFETKGLEVTMYVCGVTPYDSAHLGHGRCYVTFDMLYRLLTFLGYKVTYCRNFTDVDDKLINRADKELNDPTQFLMIANKYIESFHIDMKALGCKSPAYEPRVTTHIGQIIQFIEGLIAAGKAYSTIVGDVYFSISQFPEYGKLSKRDTADLRIGARVSVREDKLDPLDFALWKATEARPYWDSPWGTGRPGWHIECSAMAKEYFGETIDIHAGGMDLIFPHHENEIAQSEGLHNKTFARFWLHNAFVQINAEKMSKSLGNFLTLKEVCERYNPMVVRYYYLQHHYRSPLDFSHDDLVSASKSYQRLCLFFEPIEKVRREEMLTSESALISDLIKALCADLTVAKFLGIIFEKLKELGPNEAGMVKTLLMDVLGLDLVPLEKEKVVITPEIQKIIDEREQARIDKNWAKADALREQLRNLGIEIQDKK